VQPHARCTRRRRALAAGVAVLLGALSTSACSSTEEASTAGYEPATLEPVDGTDLKKVTFTEEGARRTGLRTATVRRSGRHLVVPYAALIYTGEGTAYVYTSPQPLTYVRAEVEVDRVDGDRVLLSDGPPAGGDVVTGGAAEVYGAELEIAGGH
jgi:hypothetical protein